jgi:hypothetical protein
MKPKSIIELLESRIAPATLVDAHTVTYTDVDFDTVTVKISTGAFNGVIGGSPDPGDFTFTGTPVFGEKLILLNLSNDAGEFDGANLTVTVKRAANGDGCVNVGYINSTGSDLGVVSIKGDLGQIDAGSNTAGTPAIKTLSVRSMGRAGLDSQGGVGELKSDINGALGALKVLSDVKDAFIGVFGGTTATLGSVTVGGSLIGGSTTTSGEIRSTGDMGAVKIGGNVQGGSGGSSGIIGSDGKIASVSIGGSNTFTGEIFSHGDMGAVKIGHDILGGSDSKSGIISCDGKLAGVTVGGSLIGGANNDSGEIFSSGDMGAVKIGHDVQGGSGSLSGLINSHGKLAAVGIGGSLIGGYFTGSGGIFGTGAIFSSSDMGAVKIGHDLSSGSITGANSLDESGVIQATGRIASVRIGGSIISGIDSSSADLTRSASIRAGNDIGSLTVKGSLVGNFTNDFSPVIISARGQEFPAPGVDLAIGKISVGGRVEFANILAGYDTSLIPKNADAQIGAVSVGGNWVASNLVAGAMNTASGNKNFGNADDAKISGVGTTNTAGIISKIASITIKGLVFGTPVSVSTADHYGFVVEQIGSFKAGGFAVALMLDAHNDNHPIGTTGDVTIHEI